MRCIPAAFGRLCVETLLNELPQEGGLPAAFGRLCVETGCALKFNAMMMFPAAFGRLCVETSTSGARTMTVSQPPSGGCVLKLFLSEGAWLGRLCVETINALGNGAGRCQPPSGGCVLKRLLPRPEWSGGDTTPSSFGRLCVETSNNPRPIPNV